MNPIVKKDILNVLREAVSIVKAKQLFKLRELSDHVIHNVSVFQDKDSITVAVTIYALSKLYRTQDIEKIVLPHLNKTIKFLEEGEIEEYEAEMKNIIKEISEKEKGMYIQEVFELAQIKKGSKMFEHGISMAQVAEALGISLWDLIEYVGKTRIVDDFAAKSDALEKLKFARQLFRVAK